MTGSLSVMTSYAFSSQGFTSVCSYKRRIVLMPPNPPHVNPPQAPCGTCMNNVLLLARHELAVVHNRFGLA